LKNDKKSYDRLQLNPKECGIDNEFVSIERSKGVLIPPSKDDLINLIINEGVNKAILLIQKVREDHPDSLLFDENVLNWLGYHFLYWWGREQEALDIFILNTQIFPQSANAFDSLGEAYMISGETSLAIKNYQKSLEINPGNTNAKEILKRLNLNKSK